MSHRPQSQTPSPTGIIGVLQTPFDESGNLDRTSLKRLVAQCLAEGIDGFLVNGLASESPFLCAAEKLDVAVTVHEVVGGRVPILWGTGSGKVRECVKLGRAARDHGAAVWMVGVPQRLYGRLESVVRFFQEVASKVDLPLMIQDWQPGGSGLSMETILTLREEIERFRYLKIETIPAGPKYTAILEATEGRLHVSGGWAVQQMIEALDRGVHAMIPECSMIPIYKKIDTLHRTGHRDAARELFHRLLPVLTFTNQRLDVSIWFFKRLLEARGIFQSTFLRIPPPPLDSYSERIADELVQEVFRLQTECTG